jgi:hypothetical protein
MAIGAGVWRSPGYYLPQAAGGSSVAVDLEVRAPAGQAATVRVWDVALWTRTVPDFAPVLDRGAVPTISDPEAGAACHASTGTWLARPASTAFGYQWQVDGADVAGATSAAYVPEVAAEGRALRCIVTATNAAGSSTWTTEAKSVAAAAPTAPTIAGTPAIVGGGVIEVAQTVGGFTVAGYPAPTLAHSWRVDGAEVATAAAFAPTAGDLGKALTCRITATNSAGSAEATTAAVTIAAPAGGGRQAETTAFLAAVAAASGPAPAPAQADALDGFFVAAKASSWWAKVRRLYVGALWCEAAGRIDLRDQATTMTKEGTNAAGLVWVAGVGWTSGGVASAALNMNVNPSAVTLQDSVALILWYTDVSPTTNQSVPDLRSVDQSLQVRHQSGSGLYVARLNAASGQTVLTPALPGFHCVSRTGPTATAFYGPDGTELGTSPAASQAPTATELHLFAPSGANAARVVAANGLAEGLTAAEVASLRAALAALIAAFV